MNTSYHTSAPAQAFARAAKGVAAIVPTSRNFLTEDPHLKQMLDEVTAIPNELAFDRWRDEFLQEFERYLDPTATTNAQTAFTCFSRSVMLLANDVRKMENFRQQGDMSAERCSVKARMCLGNFYAKIGSITTLMNKLMPPSKEAELASGFTKFNLGAILVRDGFAEYDRLEKINIHLAQLRKDGLDNVAPTLTLDAIDEFGATFDKWMDILADLGLYRVMDKCTSFINENAWVPEPWGMRSGHSTSSSSIESQELCKKPTEEDTAPESAVPSDDSASVIDELVPVDYEDVSSTCSGDSFCCEEDKNKEEEEVTPPPAPTPPPPTSPKPEPPEDTSMVDFVKKAKEGKPTSSREMPRRGANLRRADRLSKAVYGSTLSAEFQLGMEGNKGTKFEFTIAGGSSSMRRSLTSASEHGPTRGVGRSKSFTENPPQLAERRGVARSKSFTDNLLPGFLAANTQKSGSRPNLLTPTESADNVLLHEPEPFPSASMRGGHNPNRTSIKKEATKAKDAAEVKSKLIKPTMKLVQDSNIKGKTPELNKPTTKLVHKEEDEEEKTELNKPTMKIVDNESKKEDPHELIQPTMKLVSNELDAETPEKQTPNMKLTGTEVEEEPCDKRKPVMKLLNSTVEEATPELQNPTRKLPTNAVEDETPKLHIPTMTLVNNDVEGATSDLQTPTMNLTTMKEEEDTPELAQPTMKLVADESAEGTSDIETPTMTVATNGVMESPCPTNTRTMKLVKNGAAEEPSELNRPTIKFFNDTEEEKRVAETNKPTLRLVDNTEEVCDVNKPIAKVFDNSQGENDLPGVIKSTVKLVDNTEENKDFAELNKPTVKLVDTTEGAKGDPESKASATSVITDTAPEEGPEILKSRKKKKHKRSKSVSFVSPEDESEDTTRRRGVRRTKSADSADNFSDQVVGASDSSSDEKKTKNRRSSLSILPDWITENGKKKPITYGPTMLLATTSSHGSKTSRRNSMSAMPDELTKSSSKSKSSKNDKESEPIPSASTSSHGSKKSRRCSMSAMPNEVAKSSHKSKSRKKDKDKESDSFPKESSRGSSKKSRRSFMSTIPDELAKSNHKSKSGKDKEQHKDKESDSVPKESSKGSKRPRRSSMSALPGELAKSTHKSKSGKEKHKGKESDPTQKESTTGSSKKSRRSSMSAMPDELAKASSKTKSKQESKKSKNGRSSLSVVPAEAVASYRPVVALVVDNDGNFTAHVEQPPAEMFDSPKNEDAEPTDTFESNPQVSNVADDIMEEDDGSFPSSVPLAQADSKDSEETEEEVPGRNKASMMNNDTSKTGNDSDPPQTPKPLRKPVTEEVPESPMTATVPEDASKDNTEPSNDNGNDSNEAQPSTQSEQPCQDAKAGKDEEVAQPINEGKPLNRPTMKLVDNTNDDEESSINRPTMKVVDHTKDNNEPALNRPTMKLDRLCAKSEPTDVVKEGDPKSPSSSAEEEEDELARLKREIAQLKGELKDLKENPEHVVPLDCSMGSRAAPNGLLPSTETRVMMKRSQSSCCLPVTEDDEGKQEEAPPTRRKLPSRTKSTDNLADPSSSDEPKKPRNRLVARLFSRGNKPAKPEHEKSAEEESCPCCRRKF